MDWFYLEKNQQKGPFNEDEFQKLIKSGAITAKTMVWHSGLSGWQKYGQINPDAPVVAAQTGPTTCAECGKAFETDDLIKYGDAWICEDCKPIFLQKLKQGIWTGGTYRFGGFWIRVGAKFIDSIIVGLIQMIVILPLMFMTEMSSSGGVDTMGILINIISISFGAAYTTFFLGKYGATPGKMACGLKVIVADGSQISYLRAFGRELATWLSGIILCIGYIMAGFDKEKRALHDHICSTRVVYKK